MPRPRVPKVRCICHRCGKLFDKNKKEYDKCERLGYNHYCTNKCVCEYKRGKPNNNKGVILTRTTELSQFRIHLKMIRKRNKPCNITLEYLQEIWNNQKGICPLCGVNLVNPINTTQCNQLSMTPYRASVDRIDSSKGYIQGNIRFVAFIANMCKDRFTDEQVVSFCKKVVNTNG